MAPPPPGPTLCALLDRLQAGARSVMLGPYSCTVEVAREDDCIRVYALHGAVLGVSPIDDRLPQRAAVITEAVDIHELVTRLVWLWTRDYGPTMLATGDQLFANADGDSRMIFHLFRRFCSGELSVTEAMEMIRGKRPVDGNQARALVQAARQANATIEWRWVSANPAR
jgi:hypothetical protein